MKNDQSTTGMRQIDIDLIGAFEDDLGWLFLDESDEEKSRIINENGSKQ